ncbi:MAG TPA: S41 family peptidase [Dyella sp.]|uniref:S41 family peptidase n=1 Tax=Dyella sp. TaxID=1869338 RepID=UPI002D7A0469|nr:S41 family peptidase [Dyella sp.]HET6555592.1 S41 family peptidase [Dyella sp.]
MASADAEYFRGHTVRLSAVIDTTDTTGGAGLWLRADGEHGPVAFANSQANDVRGTRADERREVSIAVPPDATKLVFGALLQGDGDASFRHIVLERGDAIDPASAGNATQELEAAITLVKEQALRASTVDWDTLVPSLRAHVSENGWASEAYPAIKSLLGALQDHHSHFVSREENRANRSGENRWTPATVQLHPDGIGYIALPAFGSVDARAANAYVAQVTGPLLQIQPQVRHGWIIDLRGDSGGNMWPMIGALKAFLGTGPLGYFKGREGLSAPWVAGLTLSVLPPIPNLGSVPLAVLTGPHTASAGEAVVIALHGRPHTRFFGAPTAGVPTGNRTLELPDGAAIALTTSVELDRSHTRYDGPIAPDVITSSDGPGDAALQAAQAWLLEAPRDTR